MLSLSVYSLQYVNPDQFFVYIKSCIYIYVIPTSFDCWPYSLRYMNLDLLISGATRLHNVLLRVSLRDCCDLQPPFDLYIHVYLKELRNLSG